MALTASDRASLRRQIQEMLDRNIPRSGLSSDDKRFERMTGMTTKWLREQWKNGSMVTSCNSFAGWVARQIGVPATSVLSRGYLNISLADSEVAGCWNWANTDEAIEYDVHPQAGDFYAGPFPGQQWGHVGIVYDFDETSQTWTLVQGGQGGKASNMDFIKWRERAKFDRAKINGWVDIAWYRLPNGPDGPDEP
jgi:hypothetical protein